MKCSRILVKGRVAVVTIILQWLVGLFKFKVALGLCWKNLKIFICLS